MFQQLPQRGIVMPTELWVQGLLNGVILGTIYILIALGLTLVFSIMRIINFAHGEFYMAGAFLAWIFLTRFSLPYWLVVILAMAGTAFLGLVIERLIFRRFHGDMLGAFVAGLGLVWVMQMLALMIFGTVEKKIPSILSGSVRIAGMIFSYERIAILFTGIFLVLVLHALVQYTAWGRATRAAALDPIAIQLMGVDVKKLGSIVFTLGAALAGAAGVLVGPLFTVSPTMGSAPVIKAFIIIIVGGMGSFLGAMIGGLALGLLESIGSLYISSAWVAIIEFLAVIIVLLVRPQGLMGSAVE